MVELTLEELLGNELPRVTGRRFPIIDVRVDENTGIPVFGDIPKYDRDYFVPPADELSDLEEYYGKLRENIHDRDAYDDLIKLILRYVPGDKRRIRTLLREHPDLAMNQADKLYKYGTLGMAKYMEKNRDKVFDKLDAKQLFSVFLKTESYETGKKEYDRIKVLKDKVNQLAQAEEKKIDPSAIMQDELEQLLEKIPYEQKEFILENSDYLMPVLTQSLAHSIQRAYRSLFQDKNGDLIKDDIIKYLKDNYKAVEDFIEDEVPKEDVYEKFDIWDKRLKPHYVELWRELLRPQKREYKLERSEESKDREERKDLARSRGFGY